LHIETGSNKGVDLSTSNTGKVPIILFCFSSVEISTGNLTPVTFAEIKTNKLETFFSSVTNLKFNVSSTLTSFRELRKNLIGR
jgi:hypothetical protein